jgi:hypothetical protein
MKFSDLPEKQKNIILKNLDKILKEEQPNKRATAWFNFSWRNKGFEFLNEKTGDIHTKIDMFNNFYPDIKKMNLLTFNKLKGWLRIVKVGWVEQNPASENSPTTAIQEKDIPTYKKKSKDGHSDQ